MFTPRIIGSILSCAGKMHLNFISADAYNKYNYSKGHAHVCVIHFLFGVIVSNVQANLDRLGLHGTYELLVYTNANLVGKSTHRRGFAENSYTTGSVVCKSTH
jgi:hypothetical protein